MKTQEDFINFSSFASENIDRDGGVIYGASVISKGPALGHEMTVDDKTLKQVCDCGMSFKNGVKVKLNHEGGAGDIIGAARNFRIEGEKVLADIFLLKNSPNREYILELAEAMPESFGLSISFKGTPEYSGGIYFARCQRLRSVDVVADPAANASGLFSASVDTNTNNEMSDETKKEEKTPSVEDRIAALEASFESMKKAYECSQDSKKNAKVEDKDEDAMSEKFSAALETLTKTFEVKISALSELVKAAGTPVAPGTPGSSDKKESKFPEKNGNIDFAELIKNKELHMEYLKTIGMR